MDYIHSILKKDTPTLSELIDCFEKVKQNGDIAVIKFDGARKETQYTIFISFQDNKREIIRSDGDDLQKAMLNVLARYIATGENR